MARRLVGLIAIVVIYVALALIMRWFSPEELTPPGAEMPFELARLSADGQAVKIAVGHKALGSPPCRTRYRTTAIERPDRVVIAVDELFMLPLGGPACAGDSTPQHFTVPLRAPLGDRQLYDGVQRDPRPVYREAELITVPVLPEGFERGFVDPLPPDGWQQFYEHRDREWSVVVLQQRASGRKPDGRLIGSAIVRGMDAEIYEQFGGSDRSVHWVEDGWAIEVQGRMTYGSPFTHEQELMRVAEQIRIPRPA